MNSQLKIKNNLLDFKRPNHVCLQHSDIFEDMNVFYVFYSHLSCFSCFLQHFEHSINK